MNFVIILCQRRLETTTPGEAQLSADWPECCLLSPCWRSASRRRSMFAIQADAAGTISGHDWDLVKETYADRVVDSIERYAPGLRSKVLARSVLSPLDLERDNPNLVFGDSLGGSHHLDQYFLFRPAFGWSRYRTPIAGL